MKFIDWFAGIGGFRRGMELAGHKCVGFCEFDKYAVMSYTSMHLITDEQREYLSTLDLKQRQKEILKDEYRNGEWYADDIRTVYAGDIPRADCWCFGFPCQDISVAGKQLGFTGNRSSLFFRVMYLVGQLEEEERPTYLFIENVKNLLSVNGGWDFARLLIELDEAGYDAEWTVLNSKDFGVPQNRERCFIIGHLRGRSTAEVFPVEGADGADSVHGLKPICINAKGGRGGIDGLQPSLQDRVYSSDGIAVALTDGFLPNYTIPQTKLTQIAQLYGTKTEPNPMAGRIYDPNKISPSLDTCQGGNRMPKIADIIDINNEAKQRYAVWYPKKECYIAIRKLTPKECFRLQGWTDDYFEKAQFVNSDSQLYKQAGNGVTVNVIEAIADKMRGEQDE